MSDGSEDSGGAPRRPLAAGDAATATWKLTDEVVRAFADVVGDHNPVHLDDDFAATTRFGRRIGHGLWVGSLISAVVGTRLPGPGTIYLSQTLAFKAPVFIGDEVTVTVTVASLHERRPIATLETVCRNGAGEVVVTGEAVVLLEG